MSTPREKSPLPEKFSPGEYRTHDAASRRTASPTHYQLSYSGPQIDSDCDCCCSSDSKVSGLVPPLPGVWRDDVDVGTGWLAVSTLCLDEISSQCRARQSCLANGCDIFGLLPGSLATKKTQITSLVRKTNECDRPKAYSVSRPA